MENPSKEVNLYGELDKFVGSISEREKAVSRRLEIEKAIYLLYKEQQILEPASIAIFTWVILDGKGDYFAQQEAANLLCEKFPGTYLITLVHKERPIHTRHPQCPQHFLQYSGKLKGPIIHEAFSDQLLTQLAQTNLILEFPTAFPYMSALLDILKKQNPALKYQRIGEHSVINAADFEPSTGARCMGLHPWEMGIFSKKTSLTESSILQLQDKKLLALLNADKKSHTFNIAYTKTDWGSYLYFYTLLKGLSRNHKQIDICFFRLDLLFEVLELFKRKEGLPLWKEWGIGEVVIYTEKNLVPIPIANSGKMLRLIHCENLAQADMHILFRFADDLIGCTGDQTLCEAIGSGAPFFYDSLLFKRPILHDLMQLAKSRLSEFPILEHYFRLLYEIPNTLRKEIGDELVDLFNDPQFKKGFPRLRKLIQQEFAFEPILEGIVKRALFHQRFPSLEDVEEDLLKKF